MDIMITISDGLVILAVLLSPFLAVFVQRKIDSAKEKRNRRSWIFLTLMATRGNKIQLDHVQALNSIELFFDKPKKDKSVLEKWNIYLDHLNSQHITQDDKDFATKLAAWADRSDDLFSELLETMGDALGYDFDKVKIKRGIYKPQGHSEEQNDQFIIRKGLVEIVSGKRGWPVKEFNG